MSKPSKPFTLGLLVIVKNEGMVIKEFIDHYKWQGVQRIYLIDNGCTDNTIDIIQPFIDSGYISYHDLLRPHAQIHHYTTVFNQVAKRECEWLVVCDVDEYIYARTTGRTLLDEVNVFSPETSCVYLNWRVFGSSGHTAQPASVRKSFVMCEETLQRLGKSIIRCDTIDRLQIHTIHPNRGKMIKNPPSLAINHYAIMSWEYFSKIKMTRGDAYNKRHDATRNDQYFKSYDEAFGKTKNTELADMVSLIE